MKFGTKLAQPSRQRHARHEEIATARGGICGRREADTKSKDMCKGSERKAHSSAPLYIAIDTFS